MLVDKEEKKRRLFFQSAAFVGWQLGAGDKKTYEQYLKVMNLSDKPVLLTKKARKKFAEMAYNVAEKIRRFGK